jgi:hypothetical protein
MFWHPEYVLWWRPAQTKLHLLELVEAVFTRK